MDAVWTSRVHHVNNYLRSACIFFEAARHLETMPPVASISAPAFGAWLSSQRKGRSLRDVEAALRPLLAPSGLIAGSSLLSKVERGRVPSWPLLLALIRVYGLDPAATMDALINSLLFPGIDQIRPSKAVELPHGASGHLSEENASLRERLAVAYRVIDDAAQMLVEASAQIEAAGGADAPRPAGDRKAR